MSNSNSKIQIRRFSKEDSDDDTMSQTNSENDQKPNTENSIEVPTEVSIEAIERSQSNPLKFGEIRAIFPARFFKEFSRTDENPCINLDAILEPVSSIHELRQLKKQLILGKDVLAIPISKAKLLFSQSEVRPLRCQDFDLELTVDDLDFVNVGVVYKSADPMPRGKNVHDFMDFHCRELEVSVKRYSSIYHFVVVDKMLLGEIVPLPMECCEINYPQQYRVQVDFTYKDQDVTMILTGHENIPLGQINIKNVTLVEDKEEDGEGDLQSRMDENREEIVNLLNANCSQPFATIPQWYASTCLKCLSEKTFTRIGSVPPGIEWTGEIQPVCKRLWDLLNFTFGSSKPPAIIVHNNQTSSSTKEEKKSNKPNGRVETAPVPTKTKVTNPSSEKQIPTKLRVKFEEFGNYFCSSDETLKSVKEELLCRGWTGKGKEPSLERVFDNNSVECYDEYSEFALNELDDPTNLTLRLNLNVPKSKKRSRTPPQRPRSNSPIPLSQEEKKTQNLPPKKQSETPNEGPSSSEEKHVEKKLTVTMEGIGEETFDSTDELSVVYYRLLTKFDNSSELPMLHRCILTSNGTRVHENYTDTLDKPIGELENIHDLIFSVQPECDGVTKYQEISRPTGVQPVVINKGHGNIYPSLTEVFPLTSSNQSTSVSTANTSTKLTVTMEGIGKETFNSTDELNVVYHRLLQTNGNNSADFPFLMRVFMSANGTRIPKNQMEHLGKKLGELKKQEDLVFCLQSENTSVVPPTTEIIQQQQIPQTIWSEFRSTIMHLIICATEDEPGKHSMKVKLFDDTYDRSPLCSLMQCLLRTKSIRRLFLMETSAVYQSLIDCENCPVPLPNPAWTEPHVREFLYRFCHVGCFVKRGLADNYKLNELKELINKSTSTENPNTLMLFCTVLNLLEEATKVNLQSSNYSSSVSNGFIGKRILTKKCRSCTTHSLNEEEMRFIDLEMDKLRQFHLYFIPQHPWSKETNNFPMKMTMTFSKDMRVVDLLQMAKEFIPNVAVDQWKPFQARKKFADMKMLSLNVTLSTIDPLVKKICFYQFIGDEFSLLRVKKMTGNSYYDSQFLQIPPFIVSSFPGMDVYERKLLLYTFVQEHSYLKVIKESSKVFGQFHFDVWNSLDVVNLNISQFDEKKFKSNMWQSGKDSLFKMAKQIWQSYFRSDKNSIGLINLLSQYFNAIVLSSIAMEFNCPTCCEKRKCDLKSSLSAAPDDLVIRIRQQQNQNKINVIFPHELDLTQFMYEPIQSVRYKLTGIVSKELNWITEYHLVQNRYVQNHHVQNQAKLYNAQCLLRSNNTWDKLDHRESKKMSQIKTDDAVLLFYERTDVDLHGVD